ncbi:MAG: LapA family protein [Burkholderiales bacterium]|nr:LapA family protein [Burkholderiales bacterium]
MKITRWIIRIILFILVLVLILDNRQPVEFNFYGIYHTAPLPLIVIGFAFLLIGLIIGMIYGFLRSLELKAKIKILQQELHEQRKINNKAPIAE